MSAQRPIWPVSYGGSGTNWLAERAESAGRLIDRPWWERDGCHPAAPCPHPGPASPVYIYRRPSLAFASQAARGLVGINLSKLGGAAPGETDVQAFDRLAAAQMREWGRHPGAICVRFEALADGLVRRVLADALGLPVGHLDTWAPPTDRAADDDTFPAATAVWLGMPNLMLDVRHGYPMSRPESPA